MSIQLTERALQKIKETAQSESVSLDSTMLRIGVVSGGCSGLSYDLGWDTTEQASDDVQDLDGIRVVMDLKSSLYLTGSVLDFSEGLEGKGFFFNNPQAARTCACGESFSL